MGDQRNVDVIVLLTFPLAVDRLPGADLRGFYTDHIGYKPYLGTLAQGHCRTHSSLRV